MVIATSFLDILWTTLFFFAWVIFIWIAITVLIDVFRSDDLSGWGKAGWTILVVILPWIGVLVYLIAQHDGMAQRRVVRERLVVERGYLNPTGRPVRRERLESGCRDSRGLRRRCKT